MANVINQFNSYFEYTPLSPCSDETIVTRVLSLAPASSTRESIKCYLQSIEISKSGENPKYEAISYCWGDIADRESILCNDQEFSVTVSLASALRNFRDNHQTVILWADAICIDQENISERNAQVKVMAFIYKYAHQVLVWLGEASDTSKEAFETLEALEAKSVDVETTGKTPNLRFSVLHPHQGLPSQTQALRELLARPWFKRMWVVQEVAAGTDVTICCGRERINCTKFYRAAMFAYQSNVISRVSALDIVISLKVFFFRFVGDDYIHSLPRLLDLFCRQQSQDPRDKIFALYGLSLLDKYPLLRQNFEATGIVPDYKMSVQELYISVAFRSIIVSGSLDMLSMSLETGLTETNIPSWVPDFSRRKATEMAIGRYEDYQHFSSGQSLATPKLTGGCLMLAGYAFDTISELTAASPDFSELSLGTSAEELRAMGLAGLYGFIKMICAKALDTWSVLGEFDVLAMSQSSPGQSREDRFLEYYQTLVCLYQSDIGGLLEQKGLSVDEPEFLRRCRDWYAQRRMNRHFAMIPWPALRRKLTPLGVFLDAVSFLMTPVSRRNRMAVYHSEIKISGRRLARTKLGHLALVTQRAEVGDTIGLFKGGKVPLIVRPSESQPELWELRGDSYVHGIMKGEAWDEMRCVDFLFC
ncbi:MAG: hypothetical protein MMC33_004553 [Icmadophila ericetorum]|nr:hypothetical protein [Icmadophila ericetorum]